MSLEKREKVTYLKISDGKLRIKCSKEDPQAEERWVEMTQSYLYEKVFTKASGLLRDIIKTEHEEYGDSYSMILFDPKEGETYSLQMGASSRYFQSLCMHFPNFDFSKELTVIPYSFSADGNNAIGLKFTQEGTKVENYYKEWNEKTEKSKAKNGLEKFDFAKVKGDKDEMKILRMRLFKFLKSELETHMKKLKSYVKENPIESEAVKDAPTESIKEQKHHEEVAAAKKDNKSSKANKANKGKGKSKQKSNEDDDLPY